jgi:hypothetical protein
VTLFWYLNINGEVPKFAVAIAPSPFIDTVGYIASSVVPPLWGCFAYPVDKWLELVRLIGNGALLTHKAAVQSEVYVVLVARHDTATNNVSLFETGTERDPSHSIWEQFAVVPMVPNSVALPPDHLVK